MRGNEYMAVPNGYYSPEASLEENRLKAVVIGDRWTEKIIEMEMAYKKKIREKELAAMEAEYRLHAGIPVPGHFKKGRNGQI